MAWTKYQGFLAILMVATGSINTISTKWADRMYAEGSDGKTRVFNHPFLQAIAMFMGEILCILVFKAIYFYYWRKHDGSEDEQPLVKGNRDFNQLWLVITAMCDMIATSIMYIGLNLTFASSFQMLRGAVIVFTGILSWIFFRRRPSIYQCIGIVIVICGLVIVGLTDLLFTPPNPKPTPIPPNSTIKGTSRLTLFGENHSTTDMLIGNMLIVGAQLLTAAQVVLQEKFVSGLDIPPLQAVGWEGIFGFVVLSLLQVPFFYIYVPNPFGENAHHVLEDVPDGFVQMGNNPLIILGLSGTILSIAFFNFAGVSVTKELSATTRMVLDSVRTLIIWMLSLSFGWQEFHYLQVIGFVLLLIGMCLYNEILIMPTIWKICGASSSSSSNEDREGLISQPADEPINT